MTIKYLFLYTIIPTFLILPVIFNGIAFGSDFNVMGDVGCKTASINNLKNLAGKPISFFGAGDYMYGCSPSGSLGTLWNNINSKKGVYGNHECQNGQQTSWASSTFVLSGCSKGYFAYVRGGDTAVIGINSYASYKPGSAQYKFVEQKTKFYTNQSTSMQIVYLFHEPIYTPTFSGGHSPNTGLRSAYLPLIKQYDVFVISAHNHGTAFGTINGVKIAICGGGGYGGDGGGSLNGFTYTTLTFGYCNFHFEPGKIVAKLIGTSNQVVRTHMWND